MPVKDIHLTLLKSHNFRQAVEFWHSVVGYSVYNAAGETDSLITV